MPKSKKMKMSRVGWILLVLCCLLSTTCKTPEQPQEKLQNIILFIGDGMGLAQISASLAVADKTLAFESFPFAGFVKTQSADNYITDSAAGGTAISTGKKTKNGFLGVDSTGVPLKTILEYAEENGLATGLISTSSVTHATPASFAAHQSGREDNEAIASDMVSSGVDVLMGGGWKYFTQRKDSINLVKNLENKGYTVLDSSHVLPDVLPNQLVWLVSSGHTPSVLKGRGDFLLDATLAALHILPKNNKGFFLMVEGSQIDWGGHANDQDYVISEMLDFEKAVSAGLEFAKKNPGTLVLVLADHETGGMAITSGSLANKSITAQFSTKGHTGTMIPLLSYGPKAEIFSGIQDNTDIFTKMMKLYGWR